MVLVKVGVSQGSSKRLMGNKSSTQNLKRVKLTLPKRMEFYVEVSSVRSFVTYHSAMCWNIPCRNSVWQSIVWLQAFMCIDILKVGVIFCFFVFIRRDMLISLLDKHCQEENKKAEVESDSPLSEYDFLYLPHDFR